jgi:HEPN domain-containing protein
VTLDKYARDSVTWCESAIGDHLAARILFISGDPFVWLTAATLAHHALEKYLKSTLINAGLTIFNPNQIKDLDASEALTKQQCAWGHKLPELARRLERKQPAFDLRLQLDLPKVLVSFTQPLTVELAFEHFEPFFDEIRYPSEYDDFFGVGTDENVIFDALVNTLRPFLPDTTRCKHWNLLAE